MNVTKHQLINGNYHPADGHMGSIDVRECCHICNELIISYRAYPTSIAYINTNYFNQWKDLLVGDTLYHLCSEKCKAIFTLSPEI